MKIGNLPIRYVGAYERQDICKHVIREVYMRGSLKEFQLGEMELGSINEQELMYGVTYLKVVDDGFEPCEIGTALKLGAENEIIVKADNKARPDVIPVNQNLFGVYGGIYRPVWLIVTEQNNITVTDCASPGVYITQKDVSKKSADISRICHNYI
jgi:hypothetical protein